LAKTFDHRPDTVNFVLVLLAQGGLVDFQPNCDAFVWRLKPIAPQRITEAIKNGAKTTDEVATFIFNRVKVKYPLCCIQSATLATLETMDNVKLVDGKLSLV
jgi:hypothetical protein